ncbi:hypothetical protein [Gramella sp. MAR_2010_147]|uniref:hypothetical protein n=1 Tax=Gramella sp. MAR_2010_147 TaxID=1250205 RepID=UPI0008792532|nr:hypothetical protein [Gramella sp. MAR_2010_147]SDR78650.1 hypothetical protein SAMN04488553_0672 [Gramella sp. MAR_2010_147]
MRAKLVLLLSCLIISGYSVEAQILKKLKKTVENTTEKVLLKKTEQKTEQVVESSFDSVVDPNPVNVSSPNQVKTSSYSVDPGANKAKLINTEAKRSFYTSDVVVLTSDSEGKGSEYYFDSDEIAARGVSPDNDTPIFIDSEGFQYGYNDHEERWEKTGIFKSDAMAFMMPMMSIGMLKLPPEATLEATEKFKEKGMNLNTFQIVEWAFIYKPEHFRTHEYTETTGACPGGGICPKFLYNDPEYEGSWVLFDEQGRLSEIYANVNTQQIKGDGTYKFQYEPVTVNVPAAVEVKQPFQDLFSRGLDANPDNSGADNRVSSNNESSENTNPNEKIAVVDPENPLSFPGVTSVVQTQGKKVTLMLNTETMAMKMDFHDPKVEPIYFDRENNIYMQSNDGCVKAKLDLNKAFSHVEEGLKGNTLPSGINMEKTRADYYKNNFGMLNAPSNFPPITGWAYFYNPKMLESHSELVKSTVNCDDGTCQKFTMINGDGKDSYILFDKYGRLKKIYSMEAKEGSVTYTYPSHNDIRIPEFQNCQEIDMNENVFGKMMGG